MIVIAIVVVAVSTTGEREIVDNRQETSHCLLSIIDGRIVRHFGKVPARSIPEARFGSYPG